MKSSRHHFDLKGKNAEEFVHELALKTFLTDWCFLNPVLPDGKELCDLLVVFDQCVIIWQVKDLKLGRHGKYRKSEVEKNLRQLSGARRHLFELKAPIALQNPRRTIETFDPTRITEVFLISVLLGEEEDYFPFIESVKEFTVHVFNKEFTRLVLTELDTISDFMCYLRAKEALLGHCQFLFVEGGEEELLASYLMNNRQFAWTEEANMLHLEEGFWNEFQASASYKFKKDQNRISYAWDGMIGRAHEGSNRYELVARELARPTRFERRILAKLFFQEHVAAHRDDTYDLRRSVSVMDGTTYCFLFCDENVPRQGRRDMLQAICHVARGKFPQNSKVIGIATEKKFKATCSYDFVLFKAPLWTREDQTQIKELQKKLGIFEHPRIQQIEEKEYP